MKLIFKIILIVAFVRGNEIMAQNLLKKVEKQIEYSVKPFCEIPYAENGLEKPPKEAYTYSGPLTFHLDDNQNLYIYEYYNTTLYKFDKDCKLSKKVNIKNEWYDFTIQKNSLYGFNGKQVEEYNVENLRFKNQKDIKGISSLKILHNACFFFKQHLFICDFNSSKYTSRFTFIYDIYRNKLSKKIEEKDIFLPLTNCNKCNYNELKELLFNDHGYSGFLGQSNRLVVVSKSSKDDVDYVNNLIIIDKSTGDYYEVPNFNYNIDFISGLPFHFLSDNVAVFEEVVFKETLPVKIIYRKICFNIENEDINGKKAIKNNVNLDTIAIKKTGCKKNKK